MTRARCLLLLALVQFGCTEEGLPKRFEDWNFYGEYEVEQDDTGLLTSFDVEQGSTEQFFVSRVDNKLTITSSFLLPLLIVGDDEEEQELTALIDGHDFSYDQTFSGLSPENKKVTTRIKGTGTLSEGGRWLHLSLSATLHGFNEGTMSISFEGER